MVTSLKSTFMSDPFQSLPLKGCHYYHQHTDIKLACSGNVPLPSAAAGSVSSSFSHLVRVGQREPVLGQDSQ